MSKLDQPLKLKHGLGAAVAIMAVSITGTAIAGGGGGSGGGGNLHYVQDGRNVRANSQRYNNVDCPRGTSVIGGGVGGTAGFASAAGQMINSSQPFDDSDGNGRPEDGWEGLMDNFGNAGGERMVVYAICRDK